MHEHLRLILGSLMVRRSIDLRFPHKLGPNYLPIADHTLTDSSALSC